jgi:hypothetical protein
MAESISGPTRMRERTWGGFSAALFMSTTCVVLMKMGNDQHCELYGEA